MCERESMAEYMCVFVWNVGIKSETQNEQVWETEKETENPAPYRREQNAADLSERGDI